MLTKWFAALAIFGATLPAFGADVPAGKIKDGAYIINRNTFLSGNGFRVFTWHDGKSYMTGKLRYTNTTMSYELPLVRVQGDANGNHFTAEGFASARGCQWNVKWDVYSFEGKVYAAVYAPEYAECNTNSYGWEHFQESFDLQVPPTPPPPPVKPTCACKQVTTSTGEPLCTLEGVNHAVSGTCTKEACDSLIKEANGTCVAPSTLFGF